MLEIHLPSQVYHPTVNCIKHSATNPDVHNEEQERNTKEKDVEKNNNTESQIEIMRRTGREEQKKKK